MNTEKTAPLPVLKEELRIVHRFDKRAKREGERFDHAIAQWYREWLWKHLSADGPTANASDVVTLILEMRKAAAYEKKAAPRRKATWQETSARIVDVLGDLPPIIPYTGPLEPPKPETTTPHP